MRWLALLLWLIPAAALAQDKGFLATTLEQSLSGPGRTVTVTGFAGALSSRATMQELTVADSAGVWLTLKGVVLDWSRAALLSGRLEVNELSADDIIVARAPLPAPAAPPSAEAGGFSLPDLPVSVSIGKIAAKRVELGAPLLGTAAVVSVNGSLRLAGGEGAAKLDIDRIDGPRGRFALDAGYANATRQLSLTLTADEAAGGLISSLIGVPGAPALSLTVKGTGPLDQYAADIRLATDGQDRLTGKVTLASDPAPQGGSPAARHFTADLAGDIAPLFAPDYRAFFGPDIRLAVTGSIAPDGTLDLPKLTLAAQAITLGGQVRIGADGLPDRIDLTGRIAATDGAPVLVPLPGPPTRIDHAALSVRFDKAQGDGWQGRIDLTGLDRPDLRAAGLTLAGGGHIARAPEGGAVDGTVDLAATGLAPADPALAAALGDALTGRIAFGWKTHGPIALPEVSLTGSGYRLSAQGTVDGIDSALTVGGSASATVDDLSRLSALAGRSLGGAGTVTVKGTAALLAGRFDAEATVTGQDLRAGQPQLDQLLRGQSTVALSAKRDETGTDLRSLHLSAQSLSASARGHVQTGAADLTATLDMADLGALGRGYGGSLSASLHLTEANGTQTVTLDGTGRDLAVSQPQADVLLRGQTTLALAASRTGDRVTVQNFALSNPQLDAKVIAEATGGATRMTLAAKLANLAQVAPGFPGALTIGGTVAQDQTGYGLDLKANGPGGLAATLGGTVSSDLKTARVTARGTVESAILNAMMQPRSLRGPIRFDLRVDGAPGLAALGGTLNLGPLRLVDPRLGLAADPVTATVTLGSGRANVKARASVGGGTITAEGPVTLSAPYAANLTAALSDVLFKNPDLFSTHVTGQMTIAGPLTGGARLAGTLRLAQTELRVPSTNLSGADMVKGLTHVGASPAVQATRVRAGLVTPQGGTAQGPARPFPLDLTIVAPNQVFLRGRGLDAELGGTVKLGGDTDNVIPSGGFELLRGRLDILGKRFDLSQASLQLQGHFVPYVQIAASSVNDGVTSTVSITGEATNPVIAFSSSPALPQEEVLSHLLFGQGLSKISALQAAQLASAVATLAGKGGEGMVGKLRQGFGLDNLDVTTDSTGGAAVKAGKYLSSRIYTEVTVGADGKSSVNLNLDVTKSVTVKGMAGSDGNTGIGIYYQRDF